MGPRCGLYFSFCFKLSFKSNFFLSGCGCGLTAEVVSAAEKRKTFSELATSGAMNWNLGAAAAIPAGIQGDFCSDDAFPFLAGVFWRRPADAGVAALLLPGVGVRLGSSRERGAAAGLDADAGVIADPIVGAFSLDADGALDAV